jgi:hypothetical protein
MTTIFELMPVGLLADNYLFSMYGASFWSRKLSIRNSEGYTCWATEIKGKLKAYP